MTDTWHSSLRGSYKIAILLFIYSPVQCSVRKSYHIIVLWCPNNSITILFLFPSSTNLATTATLSHFCFIICVTCARVARHGHVLKGLNDKVDGDGEINDDVDSMASTKTAQARARSQIQVRLSILSPCKCSIKTWPFGGTRFVRLFRSWSLLICLD